MLELQKDISLSSSVPSLASEKTDPKRLRKCWEEEGKEWGTNVVWNLLCVRYHSTFAFIIWIIKHLEAKGWKG